MTTTQADRSGRLLRAVGAVAVIAAIVAGVPALMLTLGLVPHGVPDPARVWAALGAPDTGQVALVVFAAGIWACWALFTASLLAEAAAMVRRRPTRVWPGLGAFQRPAAALLAAAVLGLHLAAAPAALAAAPVAVATSTVAARIAPPAPPVRVAMPPPGTVTASGPVPAARPAPAPAAPGTTTYLVQPRDTLWGIADRMLGSGLRYPQIVAVNPGRIGPDNEIDAGTVLLIPTGHTVPGPGAAPPVTDRAVTQTVEPGDTLSGIAAEHDTTWPALWQANKGEAAPDGRTFTDPDLIWPGQKILIPAPDATDGGRHHTPTDRAAAHPATTVTTHRASTDPAPPQAGTTPPAADPPPAAPAVPAAPAGPATSAPTTTVATIGPAEAAPTPAPTATPGSAAKSAPAVAGGVSWPLLAGGAPLLAGVCFLAWQALRRRQRRWRRPGAAVALPPPATRGVERALRTVGADAADDATLLDGALRSLPAAVAAGAIDALPEVVAVTVGAGTVELQLARAAAAPPPWQEAGGGLRWVLPEGPGPGTDPGPTGMLAPYPALVSVGYDTAGRQWLVDLEQVGGLQVSGPADRCADLLRFMTAELAHNTWSEMLQVTCYGLGGHLGELNPDRVTVADEAGIAAAAQAAAQQAARADADVRAGMPVLAARVAGEDREVAAPHVLLAAGASESAGPVAAAQQAAATGLGRTATAVVTCDVAGDGPIQQASIDEAGVLRIAALGIEVTAHALPESEADQLAALLSAARDVTDGGDTDSGDTPPAAAGRDAFTGGSDDLAPDAADDPATPLGPGEGRVVDVAHDADRRGDAVPAYDWGRLDPAPAAGRVDSLDADVADWFDPDCVRPRVTLLGPVAVAATGSLPVTKPRVAWHTEVVALLACRPRGVTAEQLWCALRPAEPYVSTRSSLRQAVSQARRWLGADPDTGAAYLPTNPSATEAVYRLDGVLVDADLFDRLRRRAARCGTGGVADLQTALSLVAGVPFDRRRRGGYAWLADDPLDHLYSAMIVDVAHQVARHHLQAGDAQAAAAAAEVALSAGSFEDAPLLDLAEACDARGMQAEVSACIRRIMANHDVDIEEELPPHTFATLVERGWLAAAS